MGFQRRDPRNAKGEEGRVMKFELMTAVSRRWSGAWMDHAGTWISGGEHVEESLRVLFFHFVEIVLEDEQERE
jgi:hypothetical protein